MNRKLKRAAKFAIVMFALTMVCTIVWQSVVAERLYDCTDSVSGDFLRPGDWVHSFAGRSIVSVQQVVHGRSMSEPDTIKAGWSRTGLWLLWLSFFGTSILASYFLARMTWFPITHPTPNPALEHPTSDSAANFQKYPLGG